MSTPKPKRHPKYYYEDGNVIFLTNDKTLFRLHKSLLKAHSTFFRDMFEHNHPPTKDNKGEDIPIDGSSDDNPIELSGSPLATLRDVELELICDVLFGMPLRPISEIQVEQAMSLLKVSTKFQFEAIHAQVVQTFEKKFFPPWKRYSLAIDCLVDPWILQSYLEICGTVVLRSSEPAELILEFSRRNEVEKLSSLLQIREDYRTNLSLFSCGDNWTLYPDQNHPDVCWTCLSVLRSLLHRVLSGNGDDLDGADSAEFPLYKDRLLKGIQPRTKNPLTICPRCRPKETAIIAYMLGLDVLEKEVKKVMNLASNDMTTSGAAL
ncbi:hypothetical protein BDV93DRAFT_612274 [Ceratobasidium sp. AG-I]|nr:hypothetical protein BDV93DRAFT_612274 [Ceratobasidium sp. AG-I]